MACRMAVAEIRRMILAADEDEETVFRIFIEQLGTLVSDWHRQLVDRDSVPCDPPRELPE